jgi:hypothetical protein
MVSLNGGKKAISAPMEDFQEDYPDAAPGIVDTSPEPTRSATPATEPDEYDIAAEAVSGDQPTESGSASAVEASPTTSNEVDAANTSSSEATSPSDKTPNDPEDEENTKSQDEIAMEAYRKETGASPEQAKAWLDAKKAAEAKEQQRPAAPAPGASMAAFLDGVGGGIKGLSRGVSGVANAALRGTGIRRTAGLTPEVVKNRLFNRWHQDYEAGVRSMERGMTDLVKTAAAFNQLVKTSAPGRELEKIATSRGTDLRTLLGQVNNGTFEDADAKAAADQLRKDPHIQKAWSEVEKASEQYGNGLERVKHNMTQLVKNNSGKIDPAIESARLEEIHNKHSKVEQPLEIPANPLGDQKADGKSNQKSMWDQFLEMSQNGLNFLQELFSKVADYFSAKMGR